MVSAAEFWGRLHPGLQVAEMPQNPKSGGVAKTRKPGAGPSTRPAIGGGSQGSSACIMVLCFCISFFLTTWRLDCVLNGVISQPLHVTLRSYRPFHHV